MTNLFKTVALTSAIALTATSAFAVNEFGQQMTVTDGSSIEIENITSEAAGMVVIYDYQGGEFGEVLGMADIAEGANRNVIVTLDMPATADVAAVLYNGEVTTPTEGAAWIEIDVES